MVNNSIIVCSGAKHIGLKSTIKHNTTFFKNGEILVKIEDTLRNKPVIILQSFNLPNTHLMEVLLTVDAVKRAGAKYVTLILPYFPYSRMDKKHDAGVPISAKVVCDMLSAVNVDRIISFDLHNDAIQGFLSNNIQFDHILCRGFFSYHLRSMFGDLADWVFCAPDAGSVKRVKKFAAINCAKEMCVLIKHRARDSEVESMQMIGDVTRKKVIIADDMCDTGGTLAKAMDMLFDAGALKVIAVTTHGVLSFPSYHAMSKKTLFVTDTCNIPEVQYENKWRNTGMSYEKPHTMRVFSIKPFIETIIDRVNNNAKIGDLIDYWLPKTWS